MSILIDINEVEFATKPRGGDIPSIVKNMYTQEMSVEAMANRILKGNTIRCGIGGQRKNDWEKQQVFCIDIDDGLTVEEAINKYEYLSPSFIYTSFSHTDEKHKFRMVFINEDVICDNSLAESIQQSLMALIPECDRACSNLNRIFFGGKEIVYQNYGACLDVNRVLMSASKELATTKNKGKTSIVKKDNLSVSSSNSNIEAIRSLNIEVMRCLVDDCIVGIERNGGLIEENILESHLLVPQNPNALPAHIEEPKYIAESRMDVYRIINSIDLGNFLGIGTPKSFQCVVHDDSTPSASVFKGEDGTDIYKCHSESCGFVGTIITIVEKISGCSKVQAINFIKAVYNIELVQSEWAKQRIEALEVNKEYLYSGQMEFEYPELWSFVKPRLGKLIILNDLAIKHTYDEELSFEEYGVFWVSLSYLQSLYETKSRNTVNRTVTLFAILNLINKLEESNIPENMLKKAKHICATKKYKKLPTHYYVPSYDCEHLSFANDIAKQLKSKNFSMKGISREWVLRTLGEGICNEVYPQYTYENSKGVSRASDERTIQIANVMAELVESKGYATEREILDVFLGHYTKTLIEKQFKRSLHEMLEGYGYKRIRATKAIKECYGISDVRGYPFIIVIDDGCGDY